MIDEKLVTHKILEKNNKGIDYFIGDLHGKINLLKKIMYLVNFNPNSDRIICTGDLIDRGDFSLECLRLTSESWFHSVIGNHESFILEPDNNSTYKRTIWERNGGAWWFLLSDEERKECVELIINNMSLTITVETNGRHIGVIHSEVPGKIWNLKKEDINRHQHDILWGRDVIFSNEPNFISGIDFVVSGHTPIDIPRLVGNQLFIDTGSGHNPNEKIKNPHLTACHFHSNKIKFFHASSFVNNQSCIRI